MNRCELLRRVADYYTAKIIEHGPVPRGMVVLAIFGMVYAALTIALKHPDAVRSWQSLTAWRAS